MYERIETRSDIDPDSFAVDIRNIEAELKSMETDEAYRSLTREQNATFRALLHAMLAKAYKRNIFSDVLPDGRMYYNIADRLLNDTLKECFEKVATYSTDVQEALNEAAEVGIRAIKPQLNQDRIDGFVNKVSEAVVYDDVAWVLDEPVRNFAQSVVDDTIKANADFQYEAGLNPTITRTLSGNCCEWCRNLAGTYIYPDVPREVFQRHDRCRCTVVYDNKRLKTRTRNFTR